MTNKSNSLNFDQEMPLTMASLRRLTLEDTYLLLGRIQEAPKMPRSHTRQFSLDGLSANVRREMNYLSSPEVARVEFGKGGAAIYEDGSYKVLPPFLGALEAVIAEKDVSTPSPEPSNHSGNGRGTSHSIFSR